MVEGVPTELLRIVYEILFSNAPKTPYFTRDFLIAGIADTFVALDPDGNRLRVVSLGNS